MLTIEDVARHWQVTPGTVRALVSSGALHAVPVGRRYRVRWQDVWACEDGPTPRDAVADLYRTPLLTKRDIAAAMQVSIRTVERWTADGLPTRSIRGGVRYNRRDAGRWLRRRFGVDPFAAPSTRHSPHADRTPDVAPAVEGEWV